MRFLSIKEMKNLLRRKFEGNFIRVRKNRHWAVEGDWRLGWKTLCSELCSATEGQQAAPWQNQLNVKDERNFGGGREDREEDGERDSPKCWMKHA